MHGIRTFPIVAVGLLTGVLGCSKEPAPAERAPEAKVVANPIGGTPTPKEVANPTDVKPALKEFTNSIGMKFVQIPAGEFLMGSPDSDPDALTSEQPQHRVRITQPFSLGVTEVTQGQYRAVTGSNPSQFKGPDELPVENVSWDEAVAFCDKLNEKEKSQLGSDRYRLPTEAEWEYACRAGSTTRFSFGDDAATLGEFAWFEANSEAKTHPVGQKRPNAFNLFDMHGNVWEWCLDWYDEGYYVQSSDADPPGPARAAFRVDRSGGWGSSARLCQSANRGRIKPAEPNDRLGFRVARVRSGK